MNYIRDIEIKRIYEKPNLPILSDKEAHIIFDGKYGFLNKFPKVIIEEEIIETLNETVDESCAMSRNNLESNDILSLPELIDEFSNLSLTGVILSSTWYGEDRFWGVDVENQFVRPFRIDDGDFMITRKGKIIKID
jgi:hypothetical protein